MRNATIQSRYAEYEALLAAQKIATSSQVLLSDKPQNRKFLSGSVALSLSLSEKASLVADKSKRVPSDYGIKIRAVDFVPAPLMRFDADGPSHRNDVEDVPLPLRQVTTPHFHKFDARGVEIAYKTPFLLEEANVQAIHSSLDAGMEQFSVEANVRCEDDSFPTVGELALSLSLPEANNDPLAGVNF